MALNTTVGVGYSVEYKTVERKQMDEFGGICGEMKVPKHILNKREGRTLTNDGGGGSKKVEICEM